LKLKIWPPAQGAESVDEGPGGGLRRHQKGLKRKPLKLKIWPPAQGAESVDEQPGEGLRRHQKGLWLLSKRMLPKAHLAADDLPLGSASVYSVRSALSVLLKRTGRFRDGFRGLPLPWRRKRVLLAHAWRARVQVVWGWRDVGVYDVATRIVSLWRTRRLINSPILFHPRGRTERTARWAVASYPNRDRCARAASRRTQR
jgi:hypothetical protein